MPRKKKTEPEDPKVENPMPQPDPDDLELESLKPIPRLEDLSSPVLVSLAEYVYGSDGEQYNAAWGVMRLVAGSDLYPPLLDQQFLWAVIGTGGRALMVNLSNIRAVAAADEFPNRPHVWRAQDENADGELED